MRCIERPRIDVVSKNPEFKRPVECLADTSEQRAADTYPTRTRVKIEVLEFGASCIDDGKADHISTQLGYLAYSNSRDDRSSSLPADAARAVTG